MQILQQDHRFAVADFPVGHHLQRPMIRELQHLDLFIINAATVVGPLGIVIFGNKEMDKLGDAAV